MISPVMPVYKRAALSMQRGRGVYLFDTEGRRYLDFMAGIAVNALGHGHPAVVEALKRQADEMWHCSNAFTHPGLEKFSRQLVDATFADTVFFCNSGAEAVECGLKMMRRYFDYIGQPRRYRVITLEGAFHGRTLATIAASGSSRVCNGYEPVPDGFDHVPFNDIEAAEAAITPETAGFLVEPIQGDGGIRPCTWEYLQQLRELVDKHALLLFFDEIQCGMGRTGTLYAYEQAGVKPDILSSAKGIGNGFPLAACLATEKAASGVKPGTHGSTYGSNPLAMAVGSAVLEIMQTEGFMQHVRDMGNLLRESLQKLARKYSHLIVGVRGVGLMVGIQMKASNTLMVERLRDHGLLTVAAEDNVVRLLPPLIIEEQHISEAMTILNKVCEEWT
jgi:acetylornithine/N-succinyldiaminopimelate aminotransferase